MMKFLSVNARHLRQSRCRLHRCHHHDAQTMSLVTTRCCTSSSSSSGHRYFRRFPSSPSVRRRWPSSLLTLQQGSSFSTLSNHQTTRTRQTSLRLYRILLQSVRQVELQLDATNGDTNRSAVTNGMILIQPPLDAYGWGRHTTFSTINKSYGEDNDELSSSLSSTTSTPHIEELYRLFYVWNSSDEGSYISDGESRSNNSRTNNDSRSTNAIWDTGVGSYNPGNEDNDDDYNTPIEQWFHTLIKDGGKSLPPMTSQTLWITPYQIKNAIRHAFKVFKDVDIDHDSTSTTRISIPNLHKYSIVANQLLHEQRDQWSKSSTYVTDDVVRITATSKCIDRGVSNPTSIMGGGSIATGSGGNAKIITSSSSKFRYAYRVRVENVSNDQTVQLVGRYWHISEVHDNNIVQPEDEQESDSETEEDYPPPIEVNAPYTGAVGQLPVLQPGQVFEYMSGTDLSSSRGQIYGHFYMARVPAGTRSAKSGDEVDALKGVSSSANISKDEADELESQMFEATVAPFPLQA